VTLILEKIRQGEWLWIGSEVLVYEIEQTVNAERKERLLLLAREANEIFEISEKTLERAETLSSLGFGEYDALHLASAENSKADVFLTTDDQLQKLADKNKKRLSLFVTNPVKWLEETLKHED
jgi:predicted nucleic acid-binding protein